MKQAPGTFDFHEIRAFTQTGMKVIGNPATVTLVDEFPHDDIMGQLAKTLASPMTTFIRPTETPGVYDLRHFSPDGDECHICGHATMAAAEHLARQNPELRKGKEITFRINPKFQVSDKSEIKASINGQDIALTMPAVTELQSITDPDFYKLLSEAMRVPEDEIMKPSYFAPRTRDIVVAFKNQEVLLALEPDFPKLKDMALKGNFIHEGMMGTAKSTIDGFDLVNRVFLPGIDVDEDIACGSANCSIIPFWALKTKGFFDAEKRDFKVVYPYPPGKKDHVGGIQKTHLDVDRKELVLAGQASYARQITLSAPKKPVKKGYNDNKNCTGDNTKISGAKP